MECFRLVYFLLLLFSASAIGDGSQGIRSPAVDECKNLAQRQQKDEDQCGGVKPPMPVGGGLQRVPAGKNSHRYASLLPASIEHQMSLFEYETMNADKNIWCSIEAGRRLAYL